jgi:hypothetical protein
MFSQSPSPALRSPHRVQTARALAAAPATRPSQPRSPLRLGVLERCRLQAAAVLRRGIGGRSWLCGRGLDANAQVISFFFLFRIAKRCASP